MYKLADMVHYIVLSRNFHFCCFRSILTVKLSAFCQCNICGLITPIEPLGIVVFYLKILTFWGFYTTIM